MQRCMGAEAQGRVHPPACETKKVKRETKDLRLRGPTARRGVTVGFGDRDTHAGTDTVTDPDAAAVFGRRQPTPPLPPYPIPTLTPTLTVALALTRSRTRSPSR